MENLTGGTPPVRYLPCVVPCKLYFTSAKENPPVTLDDALSMVTDQMSQVVNMDDEMKDMFKDLFLRMNSQIIEEK